MSDQKIGLELVLSSGHLLRISSEVDGVLLDRVLHSLREANWRILI